MEYTGTTTVPAERTTVWPRLTDPELLTSCIVGAEEVTRVSDRTYEGVVRQSVAGVSVTMAGEVHIEELRRPEWLAFSGTGSDSRTASRMDADVEVSLHDQGDSTDMEYTVGVTFAGKLATLGSRVLRRQVKANVETYFENLADHVGADR